MNPTQVTTPLRTGSRSTVVVAVCWGCGIFSRMRICANCIHTADTYGARVWLPHGLERFV